MPNDGNNLELYNQGLPAKVRGIAGLVLSPEVAKLLELVVETRKVEAEFRHRIEKIAQDYAALAGAHERMSKDRDNDRSAFMATIKFLAECGMKEEIPGLFNKYLDGAPRYSDDVVRVILERK